MVTLITEQLHKQSLEDPYQKAFSFNGNVPLPAVGCSPTVSLSTYGSTPESSLAAIPSSKTHLLNASSAPLPLGFPVPVGDPLYQIQNPSASVTDLSFHGSPPPPPPKRHCRSLSVPEDLSRCRSTWRPSASRVWTPVRHRCQSGSAASLVSDASSLPLRGRSSSVTTSSLHSCCSPMFVSLALNSDSPIPWSFPWDTCDTLRAASSTFLPTPSSCSSSPAPPVSSRSLLQRRFSLSPLHTQKASMLPLPCEASAPVTPLTCLPAMEHYSAPSPSPSPSSACSTPSSSRRVLRPALPRCHSQPCDMRRPYLKRRHDPDVLPCSRPGLDFSKMTQIGTGDSLSFGAGVCMFAKPSQGDRFSAFSPAEFLGRTSIGPLSESEEDNNQRKGTAMDSGSFFERDCTELDLNLIEEN